jgi:hypothetical protein
VLELPILDLNGPSTSYRLPGQERRMMKRPALEISIHSFEVKGVSHILNPKIVMVVS